ncbi:hypothetical protein QYF61_001541 [Mycteria americana]|uniref:Uncharacterized protein n=1 Tax=Mycteria americana TaxID=33587 RepID=A0AAN7S535_MYCAM|nr:hypothetical protein QYF61_001541 [Mycteria americana]
MVLQPSTPPSTTLPSQPPRNILLPAMPCRADIPRDLLPLYYSRYEEHKLFNKFGRPIQRLVLLSSDRFRTCSHSLDHEKGQSPPALLGTHSSAARFLGNQVILVLYATFRKYTLSSALPGRVVCTLLDLLDMAKYNKIKTTRGRERLLGKERVNSVITVKLSSDKVPGGIKLTKSKTWRTRHSHTTGTARRLEVHKKLGGDTARTADPKWPKGYSIPYDVMLNKKTGGSWLGEQGHCSGTGWALISSEETPTKKGKEWTRQTTLKQGHHEKEEEAELKQGGEHVVTCLLQCWDNGTSSLELEGREAKQLGSLSREGCIDKMIGKGAQALSL